MSASINFLLKQDSFDAKGVSECWGSPKTCKKLHCSKELVTFRGGLPLAPVFHRSSFLEGLNIPEFLALNSHCCNNGFWPILLHFNQPFHNDPKSL